MTSFEYVPRHAAWLNTVPDAREEPQAIMLAPVVDTSRDYVQIKPERHRFWRGGRQGSDRRTPKDAPDGADR